jgi:hypothetical protein
MMDRDPGIEEEEETVARVISDPTIDGGLRIVVHVGETYHQLGLDRKSNLKATWTINVV